MFEKSCALPELSFIFKLRTFTLISNSTSERMLKLFDVFFRKWKPLEIREGRND
jgi:hypothetical protein